MEEKLMYIEDIPEYNAFDDCERTRFAVFNERSQFMADFDDIYSAINYKNENSPKNEMWYIEAYTTDDAE